jgi:hypothetical protein
VNFVLFVVNSRCLETAMLHPCCLLLNVGLGLEGSPLEKERLLMTTDWQANQFGVASQLPTER